MLTLFCDIQGPILECYMSKGTMITSLSYCELLANHLKQAIRSKLCWLLSTNALLLHDNSQPRTAHSKVAKIKDLQY
jgi:hypothetical protein